MKLYDSKFSPNAKRVRVMLRELGKTAASHEIDFMKGEHKGPDVMRLNPNGKIPTLELDDGTGLWESPAILLHLAWTHPEKNLVPTNDLRARTDLAKWMFWNASHFEPTIFTTAWERMIKPMFMQQPGDESVVAKAQDEFKIFAPVLNGQLEGKTWLTGKDFSVVDIALGTTVEFGMLPELKIDWSQYKHISAWLGRVQARPSWKE
jgi:glutathione S-transferase